MEDLIIIKRSQKHNYHKMALKPLLKFSKPKEGRFFLSKEAGKFLKVKKNDSVLFAINKKNDLIYIFKTELSDAFILRQKENEDMLNFTSKELANYFVNVYKPTLFPVFFEFLDLKIDKEKILYPLKIQV